MANQPRIRAQSTSHLHDLIKCTIRKHGLACDLNHIDVSGIEDMTGMFANIRFKGSIAQWDVSNARHMDSMFTNSPFNGDISAWNTASLTTATKMFYRSAFNGDISHWDTGLLFDARQMFEVSVFNGDIHKWDIGSLGLASRMFAHCQFNGDLSRWAMAHVLDHGQADKMFVGTAYGGDLSAWVTPTARNMVGMFGPKFRGVLPRSSSPISKTFYTQLFGTRHILNQYLREQPFGGAHFDVLRKSQLCPDGLNTEEHLWCLSIAKMGESMGIGDDDMRAYAVQAYPNRHNHEGPACLPIEPQWLEHAE